MKKIKIINAINYVALGFALLIDMILGFVYKFDIRFFYSTILMLAACGIANLIFVLIKELCVLSYDSNRFISVVHAGHILVGVLLYYLVEYLNGYDEFDYLYWLGLVLGLILPVGLFYILEKKFKNNNPGKGPKFIVNK